MEISEVEPKIEAFPKMLEKSKDYLELASRKRVSPGETLKRSRQRKDADRFASLKDAGRNWTVVQKREYILQPP